MGPRKDHGERKQDAHVRRKLATVLFPRKKGCLCLGFAGRCTLGDGGRAAAIVVAHVRGKVIGDALVRSQAAKDSESKNNERQA